MTSVAEQDELEQRTLKQPIGCVGTGLLTGESVALTLTPADPGHGIQFRRTDHPIAVPLHLEGVFVERDSLCLKGHSGPAFFALDGLLIALAHCGITDVLVELKGSEAPFLDGSAQAYVFLIHCAGLVECGGRSLRMIEPAGPRRVGQAGDEVRIEPSDQLAVQFARTGVMIVSSEELGVHMVDARRGLRTLDLVNISAHNITLRGRTPLFLDPQDGIAASLSGDRLEARLFEEARIWACLRLLGAGLRAHIYMDDVNLPLMLSTLKSLIGYVGQEKNLALQSNV